MNPLEFPYSSDVLFRDDLPDWQNNAMLNYSPDTFPFYADGYRQAANIVVTECINSNEGNDILIFPIVFLYRQYLELRLKELIIGLQFCNGRTEDFPKHHRIDQLWVQFENLYEEIGEKTTDEIFVHAKKIIGELAATDPISMAFRYPVDKKGQPTLTLNLINIRNFGEVMDRLANLLDAISDQVANFKDIASDMYREYY